MPFPAPSLDFSLFFPASRASWASNCPVRRQISFLVLAAAKGFVKAYEETKTC